MSATQAQAAVMAAVAARFDDVHQSLQQTLTRLRQEVESVKQDWQGRGSASFEQVSLAWAGEQERLLQALAQTAAAIRTAANVYSAADEAAETRLRINNTTLPL